MGELERIYERHLDAELNRYLEKEDKEESEDSDVEYFEPDCKEMLEARREGRVRYY